MHTSLFDAPSELERATAIASSESVELLWPEVSGSYLAIYRDGVLLYEGIPISSYSDKNVSAGAEYLYEIHLTTPMPEDRWPDLLSDEEIESVKAGETPAPEQSYVWGLDTTVPGANTAPAAAAALTAAASSGPKNSAFRYRTFIADATADAPQPFCAPADGAQYRFKGDNRGWETTAGTHRTQANAVLNWADKKVTVTKSVGSTTRQKKVNGKWEHNATKTASASGITLKKKAMSASTARLYMKVKVKNPFCKLVVLPIYAELTIEIKRSGSYVIISGTRRPVPHHEAYLKWTSTSWKRILARKSQGFHCLGIVSTCSYDGLTGSGTY